MPKRFEKYYYVYIMASQRNGTLYVGVSNSLLQRVYEHKTNKFKNSFTSRYNIHKLVYYEHFFNINAAITREKRIKEWKREWKIELIEKDNPNWRDLSQGWYKTVR